MEQMNAPSEHEQIDAVGGELIEGSGFEDEPSARESGAGDLVGLGSVTCFVPHDSIPPDARVRLGIA